MRVPRDEQQTCGKSSYLGLRCHLPKCGFAMLQLWCYYNINTAIKEITLAFPTALAYEMFKGKIEAVSLIFTHVPLLHKNII